MPFRGDVEGLRALAVLLVVLFHLDVSGLGGGFVGVDVFFVISGFVVTRTLWPKAREGTLVLRDFYVSRFWRLQPSFFLVALVTLAASSLILLPHRLKVVVQSAGASAALSGNFFFWLTTTGYESNAAEESPFLQMWSLAVEEQFYLLWPLVLLLFARVKWLRRSAVCWGALLAALALSEWLARSDPSLAYYLLPSRIMELGLGACLVLLEPRRLSRVPATLVAGFGLLAIGASAFVLTTQVRFPGLLALPTCLGTAALVQAGTTRNPISFVFETGALRALGRVSYAWYLWHWPPIALLHATATPLTWPIRGVVFFGTLGLAALSYRYWEGRTRRRPGAGAKGATFAMAGMTIAGVAMGLMLLPNRPSLVEPPPDADIGYRNLKCLFEVKTFDELDTCSGVKARGTKRLLIWGDSHTKNYAELVKSRSETLGYTATTVMTVGCPPLFGVRREDPSDNAKFCQGHVAQHVAQMLDRFEFDAVLVVTRVDLYETGWIRNGRLAKSTHFLSDDEERALDAATSARVFHRQLLSTMRYLSDAHDMPILFALPTPVMPRRTEDDPERENRIARKDCESGRKVLLETVSRFPDDIIVIDPIDAVCDAATCPGWQGKRSYYKDDNHLSPLGYSRLAEGLEEALRQADAR